MGRIMKLLAGAVLVVGVAAAATVYVYWDQAVPIAAMGINYIRYLGAPKGTISTEVAPGFTQQTPMRPNPSAQADATTSRPDDWPSYNKTVTSNRFSPLDQITPANAGNLKVLCTYDTGVFTGFNTGLLEVEDALIFTTEYDIFSINPNDCKENWRIHEDYQPATPQGVSRGPAYLDGRLFRGTQDARVLAYDLKTGKRLWETVIGDPTKGESAPSAPIAWDGLVFIGNAGGDYKGGKGHMFALDAKTGRIVWEFFLAPQQEGDTVRGPLSKTPLDTSTWQNSSGIPVSGGGTWTSFTLDPRTAALYVPGGNPAPDFAVGVRQGGNLYTDSVVVLDAKTGDYRYHYKIVPKDWHDWDVSNPPVPIQTRGGKQILAVAPKDGHLYGFDLATNSLLYRVPVTRVENADVPFSLEKDVHFCPGPTGGEEWNSPSYVPQTNLIVTATVDWCATVRLKDTRELQEKKRGKVWSGMAAYNPFSMMGKRAKADGHWSGWIYASDADTGVWKWRLKSNYPIVGAWTPTAGSLLFFGDVGGNLYALDSATGQKLWGKTLDGAIAGGVITYVANGAQKVAVAAGFTHVMWPTIIRTAKIVVLGLDDSGQETGR